MSTCDATTCRAIVDTPYFQTFECAKNVKILTVSGKVTLRGPVKSDAERSAVESKAKAAPGVTEVDNQLEVKK